MDLYVLLYDPSDYPGQYVLRRQSVAGGAVTIHPPLYVGLSVDAARAAIPNDRECIGRTPTDVPQIVEVWL